MFDYIKSYIEELYTIGHTRSYDAGANRAKNNKKMRDAGTDNGWLTKDDTIKRNLYKNCINLI